MIQISCLRAIKFRPRRLIAMTFFTFFASLASPLYAQSPAPPFADKIEQLRAFSSKHVAARNISVWLPAHYYSSKAKFAVLYMHDGQNIFDPSHAYGGEEWGVDETLKLLQQQNRIRDTIVVGIWNTESRRAEYFPEKSASYLPEEVLNGFGHSASGPPIGDAYLKFIVTELKPFIDKNYRTYSDKNNTFMMGSSMGGIISVYAICEYPEVFGAVAALSTHWPLNHFIQASQKDARDELAEAYIRYLQSKIPIASKGNRIYFDFGTETLDALYEPYQERVDQIMQQQNYRQGGNWVTQKFEGASHDEKSWRERVHIPLEFLLRKETSPRK